MGYRSEVALSLSNEAFDFICCKMEDCVHAADVAELLDDGLEEYEENDLDVYDTPLFNWPNIKWYSSYPEIETLTTLIDLLEENGKMDYAFARIGEDYSDIETQYGGDGGGITRISVERSFSFW